MEIILQSKNYIVLNKPAGVESVESNNKGKSLTRLLHEEFPDSQIIPVHRLDRDTSGTIIFAKNDTACKKLEKLFRERKTKKIYLALCKGIPRNPQGTIRRNLSKWSGGHKPVRTLKGGKGLTAETEYQLILQNEDINASLILFRPHQGRTHQIRVHAEALGRPVIGDHQYGDREFNRKVKSLSGLKRQALHAWRLTLPEIEHQGTSLELEASLPQDMAHTCDILFPGWEEALSAVQL